MLTSSHLQALPRFDRPDPLRRRRLVPRGALDGAHPEPDGLDGAERVRPQGRVRGDPEEGAGGDADRGGEAETRRQGGSDGALNRKAKSSGARNLITPPVPPSARAGPACSLQGAFPLFRPFVPGHPKFDPQTDAPPSTSPPPAGRQARSRIHHPRSVRPRPDAPRPRRSQHGLDRDPPETGRRARVARRSVRDDEAGPECAGGTARRVRVRGGRVAAALVPSPDCTGPRSST